MESLLPGKEWTTGSLNENIERLTQIDAVAEDVVRNEHNNFIVVGVDGTPGSLQALAWAASEAKLRGAKLLAVRVWHFPVTASGMLFDDSIARLEKEEEEELKLDIHDVLGDESQLEVETLVVSGATSKMLFSTALGAQLLVIGSKGHRGFTNAVVGSVSSQVTHYAPCPVVIVPMNANSQIKPNAAHSALGGVG